MCEPMTIMAGVSLAMSVASGVMQMQAGKAQAAQHREQAEQYEIRRIETRTAASQEARDRFRTFAEAEATNVVAAAVSGLAIDSFGSALEKNRRTALEDVDRINMQAAIEDAGLRYAAASERSQAKSAKRSGLVNGLMTIGQGVASAAMSMPGGAAGAGGGLAGWQSATNAVAQSVTGSAAPLFAPMPAARPSLATLG